MSQITITENGEYVLSEPDGTQIRESSATAVMVQSNTASAVLEFGFGNADVDFVAFVGGVISADNIINHGRGCKLMVSVTGITTGEVTIYYNPWGV
jgi:hypothetical protein